MSFGCPGQPITRISFCWDLTVHYSVRKRPMSLEALLDTLGPEIDDPEEGNEEVNGRYFPG
jgi:hypothetical protein